jgi:hypothetical protein
MRKNPCLPRYSGVQLFFIGNIMGKPPGSVFQPTLRGAYKTHVRVMLAKPHLVKDGTGSAAPGDETGQFQIFLRLHISEFFYFTRKPDILAPVAGNKIKFFEDGFMSPQQILGIIDAHRVVGGDGIDYCDATGAREMGQAVLQAVDGILDAFADEI